MDHKKFSDRSAVSLAIGGVTVKFPVKPYPSQLSMMSMIIKGLEKKQHCLLESPTGSGKSLALLCSALAWQQAQYEKPDDELIAKLKAEPDTEGPSCTCGETNVKSGTVHPQPTTSRYFDDSRSLDSVVDPVIDLCTPEEDDDFKKPSDRRPEPEKKSKAEPSNCPKCLLCEDKAKACEDKEAKRPRVPKIWFCTRTHKQIAQIAKELGRTSYDTAKMTILSSRQHSCIHPAVMKSSNKNEECKDLRRGTHASGAKCAFYQNVHRMKSHYQLNCAGMTSAWDLEELVGLGKTIKACPFYSARELVSSSNIIFCPYNYLIDPMIRDQMQINTVNQIIILDEAHNIEDSAREAGSFTLAEDSLANTTADLEFLINDGVKVEDHRPLHLLCARLGLWISEHSRNLKSSDYETSSDVWYGRDIIAHLKEWGITQDTLPLLLGNFGAAMDLGEEDIETAKLLHSSSQATLGGLFNVLRYLMGEDYKHCDDYRITIVRQAVYGPIPPRRTRDGWVTLHKRSQKHFVTNLHFWCLNPAVAFNDLSKAHCIILTSGTLSPMSSFSSELGLSFPIQLEANHVIQDSQVWVGSIGKGPKGIQLEATYKNTAKFEFQDELGDLVNRVCRTIPHGVLCFFSSYSMLQKLQDRWMATGLWARIEEVKVIVCEPRSSNKDEFDSLLQSFYETVKDSGALLLAVCRGKVSEGLDFADDNARAVITVGIPFPSIKDKQVELKRKYNDMHKHQRGLLSGAQWYEIQAYRAMNQALGRCIRHKNDWGALIIVDERFCKNPQKYSKGLSKWVRQKMKPYTTYESAISNITAFVQGRTSTNCSMLLSGTSSQNYLQPASSATQNLQLAPLDNSVNGHPENMMHQQISSQQPTMRDFFQNSQKGQKYSSATPNSKLNQTPAESTPDELLKKSATISTSSTKNESNRARTAEKMHMNGEIFGNKHTDKPSTGVKKKDKVTKTERRSIANSNVSRDDIYLSSDEDFQNTSIPKKMSHEKNTASRENKTAVVEGSFSNSVVVDDSANFVIVDEDMFDCTIPATPKKEEITIIPESPVSALGGQKQNEPGKDDVRQTLDFSTIDSPSTSCRKRKQNQSHIGSLTPCSKHSGMGNASESVTVTLKRSNSQITDGETTDSGEFPTRTTRRSCFRDKKKDPASRLESSLQCSNCKNCFCEDNVTYKAEEIKSSYISSQLNQPTRSQRRDSICKLYSISRGEAIPKNITMISSETNRESPSPLNSYWCEEDQKCYRAYKCSRCSSLVAFQIISEPALREKYLFPSSSVYIKS